MALPNINDLIGAGVTEAGFKTALKQFLENTAEKGWTQAAINSVVTTVFSQTGKNKFNKAEIVAGEQYSPSSQKIITSSAYRRSGFVPVVAGKTYTLSGNLPGAVQIAWFAAADKLSTAISNSTSKTATAPAGANFAVFNITNTGATDTTYDNTTQLEEGSQATAYEAYRTLIDKNLVDGLSETLQESDVIEKVSFNMIDPTKVDFVKRYSTGTLNFVTDNLGIAASDWIPVQEGEWYAISGEYFGNKATPQGGYFTMYGNQTALQNITWTKPVDNIGHAFKVPVGMGITHIVVSLKKKDANPASITLHGNVQLEKGEMTTPYQPYDPKKQIKQELIPSNTGSGGSGGSIVFNDAVWFKYTKADGPTLYPEKLPNFRNHMLLKDKDIVVVNTGTSLTARTSEHCTLRADAPFRPPMMHSNAFCSHVWDALKWQGQQYRRYDASYFNESGTFTTAYNLAEWDDGPYRDALTRYSVSETATLQFVIPINAWQFNFIYRTDSLGCDAKVVIAEGDGKVQVFNETTQTWVEANNFVFSMFESVPVKRDVTIPNPMGTTSVVQVSSKANTTYQKRLKMRCRDNVSLDSLSSVKNVSISRVGGGSRFMYWGVEWSPRQFMITYINSARGSHATNATAALSRGLPLYQDNEIWGFKPDLILSELGIHNDGAAAAGTYPVGQYAGLAYNYVTNTDYELSMFSRAAHFGLNPEYAFFTASIAWNFGGIEEDGSLKFGMQTASVKGPPRMMSALDKYQEATDFLRANNVICIDAAKRWVDAGFAIFGDLKTATLGSGKDGTTFTNEGSHWNDTGSAVMAKAVISLLG
ncbi:hypothetical protein OHW19_02720 [Acinetobacter baumannii]|nr:hypothetical protein [Acinetobacter baumannii]